MLNMRFSQVGGKEAQADTEILYRFEPQLSCNILLTREAASDRPKDKRRQRRFPLCRRIIKSLSGREVAAVGAAPKLASFGFGLSSRRAFSPERRHAAIGMENGTIAVLRVSP
jgi:hypothetical protein